MNLSPEQVNELTEHLGEVLLDATERDAAVTAIDSAADLGEPVTPSDWKWIRDGSHAHAAKVASRATQLRELLRSELPTGAFSSLADLDWSRIDTDLGRVIEAATAEAEGSARQKGAGRPPDEFRDELIAVIYSAYPPGEGTKSRGSHFERTVEMVLGYIGREVEDVHGLIVKALRRRPEHPLR